MKCKEFLNGLKSSGCYLVYLGSRECIFSLFRYKRIRAHYQGQNYFDGYAVKFADNMLKIVQTITI